MKPNLIFISLVLMTLLSASCSRQMTNLKSTSQLQTASVFGSKPATGTIININHEVIIDHAFTPVNETPVSETKRSAVFARMHIPEFAKKEAGKVIMIATGKSGNPVLSPTHIADRGYPQINKAGFILIAGGLLGFLLHLIAVACIVLIVLGLVILISPLFRKRY